MKVKKSVINGRKLHKRSRNVVFSKTDLVVDKRHQNETYSRIVLSKCG